MGARHHRRHVHCASPPPSSVVTATAVTCTVRHRRRRLHSVPPPPSLAQCITTVFCITTAITGVHLLGYRSKPVKRKAQSHGSANSLLKKTKTFKAMVTGYKPLSDSQGHPHDNRDMEMGSVANPTDMPQDGFAHGVNECLDFRSESRVKIVRVSALC